MTQDLVPGAVRRDVAVDGLRFSVWRSDPRSATDTSTPVLLLHGVPQTSAMWRDLLDEMRPDRVVLAPDLPGLGSSEIRGPYDMETISAHVAALAIHEVDAPIDVVGHDWGGAVALALAASRPELIRRLVVLNAAYRWIDVRAAWHMPAASLPGVPEVAFRLGGPALLQRVIELGWRSTRPLADDLMAHYVAAYADPHRISAMLGYYRDNFRRRAIASLSDWAGRAVPSRSSVARASQRRHDRLTTPALVVWGARDPVLPESVRASVVRDLAGCRCVVAPDAGHFVLEEAPEVAIPAIVSFLRERDGQVSRP